MASIVFYQHKKSWTTPEVLASIFRIIFLSVLIYICFRLTSNRDICICMFNLHTKINFFKDKLAFPASCYSRFYFICVNTYPINLIIGFYQTVPFSQTTVQCIVSLVPCALHVKLYQKARILYGG